MGFGLDWHILGWFYVGLDCFALVWVVLRWFGSFWIASGPDRSIPSDRAPRPTARHPAPLRRARRPLASAAFRPRCSTRDWADLQSIFHLPAFRLAALGRRGAPVPHGGRRGAGPGAPCVIPSGVPGNIPGGIPCCHGALLPGAENHPPGEGSGENRRGGRLLVAVARRGCHGNGGGVLCACAGVGVMAAGARLRVMGRGGRGSPTASL